MLQTVLNRQIHRAEKLTGESADYLRDILRVSPSAFMKFGLLQPAAAHRKAASSEAIHAARLVATMAEDCGPCVQTVINVALKERVSPVILRGVLDRAWEDLPPPLPLVCRFAHAVATADPEAGALSEEVAETLGEAARVDLALAITTTRMFPTLKRAMGYALSCSNVTFKGV